MKKLYTFLVIAFVTCCFNNAQAQSEAQFYTTKGDFTIQLYDTLAPVTVDSFIARVADKFYDGLTFHRVIDSFMIQGGDPKGDGTGNAGYTLPDEFSPKASNVQKTISMANSGPNTGSCQFFINLVDNTYLDYNKPPSSSKHPVFGICIKNFSVVQAIGKVATNSNDKPLTPVIIDSIRITKFAASVGQYYVNTTINAYPNPTTGIFNIDIPGQADMLTITDLTGKVLKSVRPGLRSKVTIDLAGHPKGIYLLRIDGKNGSEYGRIVIR